MIGFKMDVNTSAVEESYISYAQFRLSRAYRFGGLYMRSSRTIQGRGLRFFRGISTYMCLCCSICIKGYVLDEAV